MGGFPSQDWGVTLVGGVFINGVKVDMVLDFRSEVFDVSVEVGHVVWGAACVLIVMSQKVGKGPLVV